MAGDLFDRGEEAEPKSLRGRVVEILAELKDEDSSVKDIAGYDVKDEWMEALVKSTVEAVDRAAVQLQGFNRRTVGGAEPNPAPRWIDSGYVKGLTDWQKLCWYKLSPMKVDGDAALRTMVIYRLAFGLDGWKISAQPDTPEKFFLAKEGVDWELRGDTMNSYATTAHAYIRAVWLHNHRAEMARKGMIRELPNDRWEVAPMYQNIAFVCGNEGARWEAAILDHYDDFKFRESESVLPRQAADFFRLYHTIGNFIPVPFRTRNKITSGFNVPRARRGGRWGTGPCDYWDLAQLCVHHYYQSEANSKYTLSWLLGADQNVELCQSWLRTFGGWDGFVRKNFLEAFCPGGKPEPLWDGHLSEGRTQYMPQKLKEAGRAADEEYVQFFTNAARRMETRGIQIAAAVKEALKNKNLEELANEITEAGAH